MCSVPLAYLHVVHVIVRIGKGKKARPFWRPVLRSSSVNLDLKEAGVALDIYVLYRYSVL